MSDKRQTIRVATRKSALALAQTGLIKEALEAVDPHLVIEIVGMHTAGDGAAPRTDADQDKARFVRALENALLGGEADICVHSAKDLPNALLAGLVIAGVPRRADPRDALCAAQSIDQLPGGACVGTSSLRRKAQLLAQRPDLVVSDIRGNVDTRLSKLAGGSYDALVVAWAGLQRLGRSEGHPLSFQDMVPAAGQGCLVCEARSDDSHILELCAKLTDPGSQAALTAERALTARLGASCDTPIGAHAATTERGLCMTAFVGRSDGTMWVRDQLDQDRAETSEAEELGDCVAGRLLACGASEVLASQSTPMR